MKYIFILLLLASCAAPKPIRMECGASYTREQVKAANKKWAAIDSFLNRQHK